MFAKELDRLLEAQTPRNAELFRRLVALVLKIRPDFSPRVSHGWQTVNFHHPRAKFVMALYGSRRDEVLLVFQDGRLLDHPRLTDDGKVKKVRWIPFRPGDDIPTDEIAILIAEAMALRM